MNKPIPPVLAIVGSRRYPDTRHVEEYVLQLPADTTVVSGGSGNVDMEARFAARRWMIPGGPYHLPMVEFVPIRQEGGWIIRRMERGPNVGYSSHSYAKLYPHFAAAAHARNSMIVNYCVEHGGGLIAFLDETVKSNGTRSTIEKAEKAGVLYEVITYKGAKA